MEIVDGSNIFGENGIIRDNLDDEKSAREIMWGSMR